MCILYRFVLMTFIIFFNLYVYNWITFVWGALFVDFHDTRGGAVEKLSFSDIWYYTYENYNNIYFVRNISREFNVIYKPRILRKVIDIFPNFLTPNPHSYSKTRLRASGIIVVQKFKTHSTDLMRMIVL